MATFSGRGGDWWQTYIKELTAVSEAATKSAEGQLVAIKRYRDAHDQLLTLNDYAQIIENVGVKYGNAAAELSCELYNMIHQRAPNVLPAVPCEDITPDEALARARYIRKHGGDIGGEAGKVAKLYATRTTRKNCARDGEKMALIPSGDGCAFCKMLASRGYVYAWNTKAFDAHLHAHCRCAYVPAGIKVKGYDPDAIYQEFMDLKDENGNSYTSWNDRLNAMRRKTDR